MHGSKHDWLIKAMSLSDREILSIHPADELTNETIFQALSAQGWKINQDYKGYRHGSSFILQRYK